MIYIKKYTNLIAGVLLLLIYTGCVSNGEPEPVEIIRTGNFDIEILAPGGQFREGNNSVLVRVTRNGDVVELEEGRIDLHMPAMGAMPRMDSGSGLDKNDAHLEGDIHFEMDGAWQGSVVFTTSGGETIRGSLRVRVR